MNSWQRSSSSYLSSSSAVEEKLGGGGGGSSTKWKLAMRWMRRRRLYILGAVALIVIYYLIKWRREQEQAKISPRKEEMPEDRITGLTIRDGQFDLDGRPFHILSGSVHYFRVPRAYWKDRLAKLKAAGLNTVDTYVAWNMHEQKRGTFDFSGELDIVEFLSIARDLGLYVLLRPGPYICAEWDWGGLPPWLLSDPNMRIRTTYAGFTAPTKEYLKQLLDRVGRFQYTKTKGGPIIAVQIENEYGSYGDDKSYVSWLKATLKEVGVVEFLFTSDGPELLHRGYAPGAYATVNFNDKTDESLNQLAQFQPNAPLMTAEFWPGWFDHWFQKHHVMLPEDTMRRLGPIFARRASFNLYMFHGGTNFGFMNGANLHFADDIGGSMLKRVFGHVRLFFSRPEPYAVYLPTVTSYDYDAPLNEYGGRTQKYDLLRDLIAKHHQVAAPADSASAADPWKSWHPPTSYVVDEKSPPPAVQSSLTLTDALDTGAIPGLQMALLERPAFVEQLDPKIDGVEGLYYGFVVYRATIPSSGGDSSRTTTIALEGILADRIIVIVDGQTVEMWQSDLAYRPFKKSVQLPAAPEGSSGGSRDLILLVENMGRANYARFPHKLDGMYKGFNGTVKMVDGGGGKSAVVSGWKVYGVRFKTPADLRNLLSAPAAAKKWKPVAEPTKADAHVPQTQPTFYKLEFPVKEFADDTFVNMKDWTKGVVYANGVNLGRYWDVGPAKTLYLPGPWLKANALNELIIFELHRQATHVVLQATPDLGEPCPLPCYS